MDAALFAKMLSDKSSTDLRKLSYKYPQADINEFVDALKAGHFYTELPLPDAGGRPVVYLDGAVRVQLSAVKALLTRQPGEQPFGLKAMEEEILSTFQIEQIDTSRNSVRKILSGLAPADEAETRVYGMKKGLEFIAEPSHRITEDNLYRLYQTAINGFLPPEAQLPPGQRYRNDSVFVVSDKVEHTGLPWQKLPQAMAQLVAYANDPSPQNDLIKAAVLHFYFAWLHPYFDGNGRMARLLQLWYLVQCGYSSALFLPFSRYIEQNRSQYYKAYTLAEQNNQVSGMLDATPFLVYFIGNVYHRLEAPAPETDTMETYQRAVKNGSVTEKEQQLWRFVLSAYGTDEFSTKQLEKDFGNAAYATIRSFVIKFEALGLLQKHCCGARNRYSLVP